MKKTGGHSLRKSSPRRRRKQTTVINGAASRDRGVKKPSQKRSGSLAQERNDSRADRRKAGYARQPAGNPRTTGHWGKRMVWGEIAKKYRPFPGDGGHPRVLYLGKTKKPGRRPSTAPAGMEKRQRHRYYPRRRTSKKSKGKKKGSGP